MTRRLPYISIIKPSSPLLGPYTMLLCSAITHYGPFVRECRRFPVPLKGKPREKTMGEAQH